MYPTCFTPSCELGGLPKCMIHFLWTDRDELTTHRPNERRLAKTCTVQMLSIAQASGLIAAAVIIGMPDPTFCASMELLSRSFTDPSVSPVWPSSCIGNNSGQICRDREQCCDLVYKVSILCKMNELT